MARVTRGAAAVLTALAAVALAAGPAWAEAEGRIQDVQAADGGVSFVLSAKGLAEDQTIDADSVKVTIGGIDAPATAAPIADAGVATVTRTVMLTLDSSGSMLDDDKIGKAKEAAQAYLESLPAEVRVGLVSFADDAELVVKPTDDRAKVARAIDDLEANGSTALNDAVVLAVDELPASGSRNIVLMSDGEDEGSEATAKEARATLAKSGVVLDAVSLGTGAQQKQLAAFAKAGRGTVVTATDAAGLTEAFESAARAVESQLKVTATIPEGIKEGTTELIATAQAGDQQISDTAVALITEVAAPPVDAEDYGPIAVEAAAASPMDEDWFMPVVLSLLFLALGIIGAVLIGAMNRNARTQGRISRRLQDIALDGTPPSLQADVDAETVLGESAAVRKAVSFADRVAATRDTTTLARTLEEANLALRPGEWAVVHGLIIVLAGLLTSLFTGFDIFLTVLALVVAVVGPYVFLRTQISRRRKEFYNALPDSLQMLSGSLTAGYSLPQALDNVSKEAGGTLGFETNRALLESRLGLPIEEALEAVAQRMDSQDFHWTVMAIRINRQVGGNLAEVLTNVAKTVRERERLRRQVKALSAEGKLSAIILAVLPIGVGLFIGWRNPGYLEPLVTTFMGWVMIAVGIVLYIGGVLWMRNIVNMEV